MRRVNNNTQNSSNITTSVSEYRTEDSQNSQIQNDTRNRMILKYDENIAKIVSLGMEEKLIKSQYSKVDVTDALVKVSSNLNIFSVKQSANFLYAVSRLLSHGYILLNQELKDFFSRFKDQLMKQQQQKDKQPQQRDKQLQQRDKQPQQRNKQHHSKKKELSERAKEYSQKSLLGYDVEEHSKSSIDRPRHVDTDQIFKKQVSDLISSLGSQPNQSVGSDQITSSDEDSRKISDPFQKSFQMLGNVDFGGDADFDFEKYQIEYSDKDSSSFGFDNSGFDKLKNIDISQELNKVGDMSQRIVRNITSYAGQQSSKKKKKLKNSKQKISKYDQKVILDDFVDQDKQQLSRVMEVKIHKFFSQEHQEEISYNYSDIAGLSTTLQQPSILSQSGAMGFGDQSIRETPFLPQSFLNQSMAWYLNTTLIDYPIANLTKKFDESMQLKETNALISEDLIKNLEKTIENIKIDIPNYGEGFPDIEFEYGKDVYDQDQNAESQGSQYDYNQKSNEQEIPTQLPKIQHEKKQEEYSKFSELGIISNDRKNLTEEEKKKVSHYEKLFNRLSDIIQKEDTANFNNVYQSFKVDKKKSQLFYDFLELQKLGQLSLTQNDPLSFSPIQISVKQSIYS